MKARISSAVRKLALALLVLVGALLALELATRGWLRWRGAPYESERARAEVERIRSRALDDLPLPEVQEERDGRHPGSRETLHPYLGFEATVGPEAFARELRDSLRPQARAGRFRVLVLGGSVAAIFGRLGHERLAELLQADERMGGREVVFGTLARPAFKQPQSHLYLSWAFALGVRPDAVLLVDGFNEVTLGLANAARGMHPSYPAYAQWMSLARAAGSDEALLERWFALREAKRKLLAVTGIALDLPIFGSALLGEIARRSALGREAGVARETAAYLEGLAAKVDDPALLGPPFEGSDEEAVRSAATCWFESSRLTAAMCAALEIPYLHVLQPTLFDAGAKPRSSEEQAIAAQPAGWLAGVELGYPMLRELGGELRAQGIAFLDATQVFAKVEETLYYDVCHFGEDGNRRLAEAIAPALLELVPEAR